MQMEKNHKKRCSISLLREIKATIGYHYIPIKVAKVITVDHAKC